MKSLIPRLAGVLLFLSATPVWACPECRAQVKSSGDSLYLHRELWSDAPGTVKQGRFWSWAKRAHAIYWQAQHS